jgi:hypothetical protein
MKRSACTSAIERWTPQRVPISPQKAMKRSCAAVNSSTATVTAGAVGFTRGDVGAFDDTSEIYRQQQPKTIEVSEMLESFETDACAEE